MNEKEFLVSSKTVDQNGLKGKFELDTGEAAYAQDISAHLLNAQRQREYEAVAGRSKSHRKFATIPDSVAIKIMEDHGLNLHDQTFMSDPHKVAKFKKIMMDEYRNLVINT